MANKHQQNMWVAERTSQKLDEICALAGYTKSEAFTVAINDLHRRLGLDKDEPEPIYSKIE